MINQVPLVSILIPLFNKEAFIESTIASALDQVHEYIEVLVIDDGSTDGSLARVLAFTDPRLLVRSRENLGGNSTRNELIEWAKGEYIQFLDADDLLDPQKISRQLAAFWSGVDVVFCGYFNHAADGSLGAGTPPPDPARLVASLAGGAGITVSGLYRSEALRSAGGFDATLDASQEYELHLRSVLGGYWRSIAVVPEFLATRRETVGSITSDDLRVYRAKADALRSLLPLARNQSETEHLANALVNAGRHLARLGERSEAASVSADALVASPVGSASALPRRMRWLRWRPAMLARWESVETRVRERVTIKHRRGG